MELKAPVLDYHLHLWAHGEPAGAPLIDQIAAYCSRAEAAGIDEIAVTEHLFRFKQAERLMHGFWDDEPDGELRRSMASYWRAHALADLDEYVSCVQEAKAMGLPVALGLEVDYYPGRMGEVATLLAGYPFDVLLGSVHWLGAWRFDDIGDQLSMSRWQDQSAGAVWDAYSRAIEDLAGSGTCDVLAHLDLVKVAGHRPPVPEEWWDRLVEVAAGSAMAVEVSSAGWRKPIGEPYPAPGLLDRLVSRGVALTTASDAHRLVDVADHASDLRSMLHAAGVSTLQAFRGRVPLEVPLDARPTAEGRIAEGSIAERTSTERTSTERTSVPGGGRDHR